MQITKTGDSHEKLNKKLAKLNRTLAKYMTEV